MQTTEIALDCYAISVHNDLTTAFWCYLVNAIEKNARLFLKRAHFARFNVHNSLLYCLRGNCLANESLMTFDAFQFILVINWTNRLRIIFKYSKYSSIVSQFYCLFFFVFCGFFFSFTEFSYCSDIQWTSVTKSMSTNK